MEPLLGYLDSAEKAERERFLFKSFVKTPKILRALDPSFPFVCGRKGSGKSAVSYYLAEKCSYHAHYQVRETDYALLHNSLVVELTSLPCFSKLTPGDISAISCKIWSYVLHVSVVWLAYRHILKNGSLDCELGNSLFSFLADQSNHIPKPLLFVEQHVSTLIEQAASSANPFLFLSRKLDELFDNAESIKLWKATLLALKKVKLLITIDTAEKYETDGFRLAPYRGMCKAVLNFHAAQAAGKNVHIKCFLPAEMIQYVFIDNFLKFKANTTVLDWRYSDLLEFVCRRYATYLKRRSRSKELVSYGHKLQAEIDKLASRQSSSNSEWKQKAWHLISPSFINNKYAWEEDSAAFILRHTQKRPRDILSCMNYIVNANKISNDSYMLTKESIYKGLHSNNNISQLLTNSLAVFDLPEGLNWRTDMAGLVRFIFNNEATILSYKRVRHCIRRLLPKYSGSEESNLFDSTIRILLRSGLVGELTKDVREWKDRNGITCRYYIANFEYITTTFLEVNDRSTCALHPVLADSILTAEWERPSGVIYHVPEPEGDLADCFNNVYESHQDGL